MLESPHRGGPARPSSAEIGELNIGSSGHLDILVIGLANRAIKPDD
jgi:hypothetical protein